MSRKNKPPGNDESPEGFAAGLDDVRPLGEHDKRARPAKPRPRPLAARTHEGPEDAFEHPDPDEPRLAHRASVAARTFDRLARGALETNRKLDLHGMRADSARDAIRRSIRASAKAGETVLMLIHGRGKHSGGFAVLRDALPEWLEAEDRVLAFAPAKRDGDAAGATCVLLRT
ncbi:MAG: Smr/MutS family protein [Myxococcota bacterium]|nr:Smr/MutS family protein [Myxococcota bacterium]